MTMLTCANGTSSASECILALFAGGGLSSSSSGECRSSGEPCEPDDSKVATEEEAGRPGVVAGVSLTSASPMTTSPLVLWMPLVNGVASSTILASSSRSPGDGGGVPFGACMERVAEVENETRQTKRTPAKTYMHRWVFRPGVR